MLYCRDEEFRARLVRICTKRVLRLPVVGYSKGYSKALEYKYRVKTAALDTLKRYSILSLTLYLEQYSVYSIVGSGSPTS
jgi:hypothetical protein